MIRALIAAGLAVAATPAAAQQRVDKPLDLSKPAMLNEGMGAVVVGFRRPDAMSRGKSGIVGFARYDMTARDLASPPADAKKREGDTYWATVRSADKKAALEHVVIPVSPGDYVLAGATPGPGGQVANSFCLGAPTFGVGAGEVVYFGDVTPYVAVRVAQGSRGQTRGGTTGSVLAGGVLGAAILKKMNQDRADAMAYSSSLEAARQALASQPLLAAALRPANLRNHATFTCLAQSLTAYVVPGAPALEPMMASTAP